MVKKNIIWRVGLPACIILLLSILGLSPEYGAAKEIREAREIIDEAQELRASETPPPPLGSVPSSPPDVTAVPEETSTPEPETPQGRLIHKKYKSIYLLENGRKLKKSFVKIQNRTYYFDRTGAMFHGWLKRGGQYYYLDRITGKQIKNGRVDGIRIHKGHAVQTRLSCRKIETMRTAARLVKQITKKSDSMEQKKYKCYQYIIKCGYRRYRLLEPIYKKKGWESTFANDIFKTRMGCCVAESCALAFLLHECGYREVYVCHDTSHAWVELNGKVYDTLFSETKDFWKYYGGSYSDYGCHMVDKRKI